MAHAVPTTAAGNILLMLFARVASMDHQPAITNTMAKMELGEKLIIVSCRQL